MKKAVATSDQAERTKLYEQAQVIFKEQAPWLTIAHSLVTMPMRKNGHRLQDGPARLAPLRRRRHQPAELTAMAAAPASQMRGAGSPAASSREPPVPCSGGTPSSGRRDIAPDAGGTGRADRHMLRFILRRIGLLIPTFIGVSFVAFAFIRLLPGDPVLVDGRRARHRRRSATPSFMHQLRLRPADLEAVSRSISGSSLHGDFGISIVTKRPVLTEFFTLFPATLELSICAMIFAIVRRRAGRRARGGQARQLGRPRRHGRRAGRLFDADLLVGAAAHHLLLRLAALDAGLGPHRPHLFLQAGDRLHADRQPAVRPEGRVPLGGAAT